VVSWALWLGLALAAPEDDEISSEEEAAEEVIVYGEILVARARRRIVNELESQGYRREIERDGKVIYRHDSPWKGQVVLHDDGWVQMERSPLRFQPKAADRGATPSATQWMSCLTIVACLRPGGILISKRKLATQKRRTYDGVAGEIHDWSERIADLAVDRKVEGLPERLTEMWEHGVPLDGHQPLVTVAERKAALLSFWATRTDTVWGEEVRQTVEAFIRGEVQYGEHPFTDDEITAFNAVSGAGRPLSLVRLAPH
jgi:hypothetical protein